MRVYSKMFKAMSLPQRENHYRADVLLGVPYTLHLRKVRYRNAL